MGAKNIDELIFMLSFVGKMLALYYRLSACVSACVGHRMLPYRAVERYGNLEGQKQVFINPWYDFLQI